jgi:hypothetical protein
VSIRDLTVGPVSGLHGEAVPGGYALQCGGDTRIFLLTGTSYTGCADRPLASLETDRLEAVADDLRAHGVPPEEFSEGAFRTDRRGVGDLDDIRIAWIRDPDDHVISIFEPVA